MSAGLSDLLCAHVVRTRFDDLPSAAVEAAKRSLLDAIGVSLGASGLGEGVAAFAEHAIAAGGKPESSIFGYEERVPAQLAAVANGAMAHALDFEDAYDGAPLHPNAAAVPAALALAQARGVSGREILAAIAVGCDLTCRLALCLRTQAETLGWYPPPIFGAYGAVATAGKVIGLDAERMRDAFSLALSQATCSGEIKYSPNSLMRAVRDAFSAQTGVLSALLAERGVTGFERPFEGECGFFRLFANSDYDPDVITTGLGRRFLGAEVSYKLWPSCRGTHGLAEAALELRAEGAPVDQIVAIEMRGDALQQMLCNPLETKRAPRTAIDAKFSAPFVVATALARGSVTLDDFTPERLRDPKVLALAQKATHTIDATHPTSAGGTVVLRLADGRALQRRVEAPLGAPDRPVSWDALSEKFKVCAARARRPVGAAACQTAADAIAELERADSAAEAIFATLTRS